MQIYAASYVLPVSSPPIPGGAIVTENGRIVDVGSAGEIRKSYAGVIRDFPGCVIMPGIVNAHSHLELTHFPSWKLRKGIDYSPRTYVDWVIQVIKIKRALSAEELQHSLCEGIRKSLECGTTAIGDIFTDCGLLRIYRQAPLSGRLYCEAIGQDPARCKAIVNGIEETLATFRSGRLKTGISPHAPHTLSRRLLEDLLALSRKYAVPTAIHLAESSEEDDFLYHTTGNIAELLYPFAGWEHYLPAPRKISPTAYLDSLGALTPTTTVIHCVHITPADAHILKRSGAAAVLCPRSNDMLAVGKAPAPLLKRAGIPLALGTDSLASNDSLSMWDEMRFLLETFPDTFSPAEALEMATLGAAKALHLESETGSLDKQKRADFLVVSPGRTAAPEDVAGVMIEESQIEEIFIGGDPFLYESLDFTS